MPAQQENLTSAGVKHYVIVLSHYPGAMVMQMTGLLGPNLQGSARFTFLCAAQHRSCLAQQ